MAIKAPRGTFDILPDRAVLWNRVESTARRIFELYGYGEIRTPIFESVELFAKSIGEMSDIVDKEMYVFQKGREQYALRPESTASVVRAFIEHNLDAERSFQKLYYIGPMFRAERPQAGRYRQFHQMGVEAFGSTDPLLDAECIVMASAIFAELGISGQVVKLNSLGNDASRGRYREALKAYLASHAASLCDNCRSRIERNVLRALDCKEEACRRVTRAGPNILDYLDAADRACLETVTGALGRSGIACEIDGFLVRGLDYYTGLVYEFLHGSLGAQNSLGGGGRYDRLVADRGGPQVGATGLGIGMDRVILVIEQQAGPPEDPRRPRAVFINVGDEARPRIFDLVTSLRRKGIAAEMDFEGRSPKAQLRAANKLSVPFAVFVGQDEIRSGNIKIKNMQTGEEIPATFDTIEQHLTNH